MKLISELLLFLRHEAAATCGVPPPPPETHFEDGEKSLTAARICFIYDPISAAPSAGAPRTSTGRTRKATDRPLVSANNVPGVVSLLQQMLLTRFPPLIMIRVSFPSQENPDMSDTF